MKALTALIAAAACVGVAVLASPLAAQERKPEASVLQAQAQQAPAQPAQQQQPKAQQPRTQTQPAAQPKPAPAPVAAEDGEKIIVKIAVLDVDTIRRDAAAAKDIREQINKYRVSFQAEIQKEEDELRNANQELSRQRTILSPEAFAAERKKFEDRLVDVQRMVQKRKDDLDKSYNDSMRVVNDALNDIVVDLANQEALTLILRRDQTVLVAKALEITSIVLERLNAKIPRVKIAEPGKEPAPAKAASPAKAAKPAK